MSREIGKIICSCGGEAAEVDTTPEEDKKYGCRSKGCCAKAFECPQCKVHWVFSYDAPEPAWD